MLDFFVGEKERELIREIFNKFLRGNESGVEWEIRKYGYKSLGDFI